MDEPFTAVDLPRMHSPRSVAEHEVLMSFNGDDDAVAFTEWWHAAGAVAFNNWLKARARIAEFPATDFGELKGSPLDEIGRCQKCGGQMAHYRLKGYRCSRCD